MDEAPNSFSSSSSNSARSRARPAAPPAPPITAPVAGACPHAQALGELPPKEPGEPPTRVADNERRSAGSAAAHHPPGPAPRGKLGTLLSQLQLIRDPLGTVGDSFATYGDLYRVRQGDRWVYSVRHPDHIREVLLNNAAAFDKQHSVVQRLSMVVGDSLLTSDGEDWRRQRRLAQPAFARPRLAEYCAVMVDEAAAERDRLTYGGPFDFSEVVKALTQRIVTRTLFGQSLQDDDRTRVAMSDLNRWFAVPLGLTRFIPGAETRFARVLATLDSFIDRAIDAKSGLSGDEGRQGDLLSALMRARDEDGASLSRRELRDQLLALYLAGHETTTHALTWAMYLLTQHPEVLLKLEAEQSTVLDGRLPSFEDLQSLPYLDQVIKETLRLFPPAYLLPRRAAEDTFIGTFPVPKGSEIVIWIYFTQRDERLYQNPAAFRPERFAGPEDAARAKCAYLPFGAGQRACIGQMFAMIEAKVILATWLPHLQFEYTGRRAPVARLGPTLTPRDGMPMRARRAY